MGSKRIINHRSSLLFIVFSFFLAFGLSAPLRIIPVVLFFFIISGGLFAIIHIKDTRLTCFQVIIILLVSLFFVLNVISFIRSAEKEQALLLMEERISLYLLPILFLGGVSTKISKNWLLEAFVLGNIVIVGICLSHFLYDLYLSNIGDSMNFYKFALRERVNSYKHYAYLGMNLSIAIVVKAYLLSLDRLDWRKLFSFGLLAILFVSFIALIEARTALITLFMALVYVLVSYAISRRKWLVLLFSFSIPVFGILLLLNIKRFNFQHFQHLDLENPLEVIDPIRNIIWKNARDLISQKPILGYGLAESKSLLADPALPQLYDSHNQFLELMIEGGFLSVLVFTALTIFAFGLIPKGKHRWLGVGILLIFLVAFCTESILNRISGMAVFIFFTWMVSTPWNSVTKPAYGWFSKIYIIPVILSLVFLTAAFYFTKKINSPDPCNPRTFPWFANNLVPNRQLPKPLPDAMPLRVAGFYIDSTSKSSTWGGNAYSFPRIGKQYLYDDDSLIASVYCWVSEDFNGGFVRISSEGTTLSGGVCKYDQSNRGTWQYLEISSEFAEGEVPVYMYLSLEKDTSFRNLRGKVIFAYPQYRILKKANY